MKKPLLLLISLVFLGACQSEQNVYMFTSFREPEAGGLYFLYSHDGYHWTDLGGPFLRPEAGNQQLIRDPSIVQGPDGTFHMVWTSSWQGDLGFGYAHSEDLIHWSEQKYVPVMEHQPTTVNVWAPELYYDEGEEQYIILWASTIPFRFKRGIEEERNNHRMFYTTTGDFETFSETELFFNPGYSVIDAIIVKKDPGDYVLVFKDNTRPNRNLKAAFSKSPLGPFTDITEAFTQKFTEGPTELKLGNTWLIYYDMYREDTFGAVKTTDFRTFTNVSDQIDIPEGHKHGTIFTVSAETFERVRVEAARLRNE